MCETWRAAPQTDVVFTEAPRGHLGAAGGFKTFVATSAWPRVGALCGARHNAAFADVVSSEEELRGGELERFWASTICLLGNVSAMTRCMRFNARNIGECESCSHCESYVVEGV